MNSHKHISFHFPAGFAMCSSEPKEAEHCSKGKTSRQQIHPPRRTQKTRTSTQSHAVPIPAVFKAQRPSGRCTSGIRKSHELGRRGRPGTGLLPSGGVPGVAPSLSGHSGPGAGEQPPGLDNSHPARLFLSSRPGR